MTADGSRPNTVLQPPKNRSVARSDDANATMALSLETSKTGDESVSKILASKTDMLKFFLDIEYVYNPGLAAAYQKVMRSEHFGTGSQMSSVMGLRTPKMLRRWMAGRPS